MTRVRSFKKWRHDIMKQTIITALALLATLSCGQQAHTPAAKTKKEHPGLFPVQVGGKYGYMDKTGRLVINPQFDGAWSFSEGLAMVGSGGWGTRKYGYIDKTGKYVIAPQFDKALSFSGGLARVKIGGKWGYIDMTGKLVIAPQFDKALSFSGGLARVKIGGKWGYIDMTGKFVWEPSE